MSDPKILFQEMKYKMFDDPDFRNFIKNTIVDAIKECGPCPVPKDVRDSMSHWTESVKTIGDGNFDKGIERMRRNHDFTSWLRTTQSKIGGIVLKIVVGTILGAILTATAVGIFGKQLPWK